jgi:hypothetical protein
MTELYHPDFTKEPEEERLEYWKQIEQDSLRALAYARKMLGQLAIESSKEPAK